MLSRKIFITVCCMIILAICACTKSNQPIVAGSGFCDTSSVTYTNNVLPILQTYCYACHGNGNTAFSNGVSLDGYNNAKGWADVGYLVGDVRHDAGFTGMPYGKPKISACEINAIVAWLIKGNKNKIQKE